MVIVKIKCFLQVFCTDLTTKRISEDVVYNELFGINASKSTGLDEIPGRLIKDRAVLFKKPITTITITMVTTTKRGAAEAGEGEVSRHSGPETEVAVEAGDSDIYNVLFMSFRESFKI